MKTAAVSQPSIYRQPEPEAKFTFHIRKPISYDPELTIVIDEFHVQGFLGVRDLILDIEKLAQNDPSYVYVLEHHIRKGNFIEFALGLLDDEEPDSILKKNLLSLLQMHGMGMIGIAHGNLVEMLNRHFENKEPIPLDVVFSP